MKWEKRKNDVKSVKNGIYTEGSFFFTFRFSLITYHLIHQLDLNGLYASSSPKMYFVIL